MLKFNNEVLQDFVNDRYVEKVKKLKEKERLKKQYLRSKSRVQKENIKRRMEQLEQEQEQDKFAATQSFYRGLQPMPDEELKARLDAVGSLPTLLQNMYKVQRGLIITDSIELAAQVEHWDQQIQLLEQLGMPLNNNVTEKDKLDARRGFEELPEILRSYLLINMKMPLNSTSEQVVDAFMDLQLPQTINSLPKEIIEQMKDQEFLPEYNDIEFIERSRFIEDLMPSIAALEKERPSPEEVDQFMNTILDQKTFGLRSKPERLLGGYLIRGMNNLRGDDASDKLVEVLNQRLANSSLAGKLQFFFLPDPVSPTIEDRELGTAFEPVLLVTGVSPKLMYRQLETKKKMDISLFGLLSVFAFSFGACLITDTTTQKMQAALGTTDLVTILQLLGNAISIGLGLLFIQLIHELGHRIVALQNKMDVGFPNLIGSVNLGLIGAITPFNAPPKNLKYLFDFSIVGPIAGLFTSIGLLLLGLEEMIALDISQQEYLPALPIELIRSSALGSGIIESFLGSIVFQTTSSVLPLSPLAIAGFLGLITNALALLPIGRKSSLWTLNLSQASNIMFVL